MNVPIPCYLVETGDGKNILILAAFPQRSSSRKEINAGNGEGCFLDNNAEKIIASTRKLLDLAQREHVALTIFGHDGRQWPTLKKVPDFYG